MTVSFIGRAGFGSNKKNHDLGGLVTTDEPFKDPTISLVENSRT